MAGKISDSPKGRFCSAYLLNVKNRNLDIFTFSVGFRVGVYSVTQEYSIILGRLLQSIG